MVEHVAKCLLKSRFGDDEGDLFKAVDGFGARSDQILPDFRRFGSMESEYHNRYFYCKFTNASTNTLSCVSVNPE